MTRRQPPADSRPNFLFVYTDDQRWDALGVVQREMGSRARFPWFKTPHLDRLADGAVRFRNAFVVSSLCAPSRAAFMTGRYNHENGVANNHSPFPANSVTHATLLRGAGYRTGYIGKWHMGSQRERPGFDFAASFIGQGRYNDCPFVVDGKDVPTRGWVDDVSTDFAVDFLKANRERRFSLIVGYKASHGPWEPPARAAGRFAGEVSRPVPNLTTPAIYRNASAKPGGTPTEEMRERHRNYFRTLSAIDDNIGRLLDTLDQQGLAENTVVVFTSDNGYYLGEHGLGDKRTAYDESLRVPFLIRYPKASRGERTQDDMALNVDVAPTFLDLAGLRIPREMQGYSLKPYLEGKRPARPRDAFFYEYFYEQGFASVPTTLAVRATDAKLIQYPGHDDWTELFDLKADPYETKNLWNEASARPLRERMTSLYDREAKAVGFQTPPYADTVEREEPTSRNPRPNKPVLRWEAQGSGTPIRIEDRTGSGNAGTNHGVSVAEGREGKRAFRFDGKGFIEAANSPSLNPVGGAWTVTLTLYPETADGVLLARGGQSQGYTLFLEAGSVFFAVTADDRTTVVGGGSLPLKEWVTVRAVITADKQLQLYKNGNSQVKGVLHSFLTREPNDRMQLGADLATPVRPYRKPAQFVGLIESVEIFSGEQK